MSHYSLLLLVLSKFDLKCSFNSKLNISGSNDLTDFVEKIDEVSKRARCKVCAKVFYDKGTATKHVENIHFPGHFTYSCNLCDASFDRRNLLYLHMTKSHHHPNSYNWFQKVWFKMKIKSTIIRVKCYSKYLSVFDSITVWHQHGIWRNDTISTLLYKVFFIVLFKWYSFLLLQISTYFFIA